MDKSRMVVLEGEALEELRSYMERLNDTNVYRVRFYVEEDPDSPLPFLKVKINEGMWSPPIGFLERRRAQHEM